MADDKCAAVPLAEQLRSVPQDAVLRIDTPNALGCMDTRSIPVGRLCHEAADAMARGVADQEHTGRVEAPALRLADYVNAAHIIGSDMPYTVITKLQASIDAATVAAPAEGQPGTDGVEASCPPRWLLTFEFPGEAVEAIWCANAEAILAALTDRVSGEPHDLGGIRDDLMRDGVWNDEGGCIRLSPAGVKEGGDV